MSFTLLQWNCMYSEDLASIADFIKRVNPDIVCLQELTAGYHADIQETGEWIAKKLAYYHHCTYGPMLLPNGLQTTMGNGILSRLPFSSIESFVIQDSQMEGVKLIKDSRFYLQASIVIDDRELCIGTTHLPFHPLFQTTAAKQQMVERILEKVPTHECYILAGDLNTTPRTKAAKTFRQKGLKNAGPSLSVPTWTTKPFAIGPWNYDELLYRLDYVLHKTGIRIITASILNTELSDHLPILIEFELTKK